MWLILPFPTPLILSFPKHFLNSPSPILSTPGWVRRLLFQTTLVTCPQIGYVLPCCTTLKYTVKNQETKTKWSWTRNKGILRAYWCCLWDNQHYTVQWHCCSKKCGLKMKPFEPMSLEKNWQRRGKKAKGVWTLYLTNSVDRLQRTTEEVLWFIYLLYFEPDNEMY